MSQSEAKKFIAGLLTGGLVFFTLYLYAKSGSCLLSDVWVTRLTYAALAGALAYGVIAGWLLQEETIALFAVMELLATAALVLQLLHISPAVIVLGAVCLVLGLIPGLFLALLQWILGLLHLSGLVVTLLCGVLAVACGVGVGTLFGAMLGESLDVGTSRRSGSSRRYAASGRGASSGSSEKARDLFDEKPTAAPKPSSKARNAKAPSSAASDGDIDDEVMALYQSLIDDTPEETAKDRTAKAPVGKNTASAGETDDELMAFYNSLIDDTPQAPTKVRKAKPQKSEPQSAQPVIPLDDWDFTSDMQPVTPYEEPPALETYYVYFSPGGVGTFTLFDSKGREGSGIIYESGSIGVGGVVYGTFLKDTETTWTYISEDGKEQGSMSYYGLRGSILMRDGREFYINREDDFKYVIQERYDPERHEPKIY